MKKRLETLLTLWNKCDGYLVLIEEGTNAGFSLLNEAREFLLTAAKSSESDPAFIFAPVRTRSDQRESGSNNFVFVLYVSVLMSMIVPVRLLKIARRHAISE